MACKSRKASYEQANYYIGAMEKNSSDIRRLLLSGREIVLVGTAHISQESTDLVRRVIEEEKPDTVCVELDEGRMQSLAEPNRWKALNLKDVIRRKQLATLVVNLVLSSYQKRMGSQTGVQPGAELQAAVVEARERGIPVVLADRDIKVTLKRAWACTPWYRKFKLLGGLLESVFDRSEVSEAQLREIRQQDTLSALMNDFGKTFPELKQVLISERDQFLAERIRNAPGDKVVAVVGAGHLQGIQSILESQTPVPPESELTHIPPPHKIWAIIGWGIPSIIVLSLFLIGYLKGFDAAADNALYWILMTGGPAAFGTALALAHPLTIIVAFVMAPLTTLHPLIGVGFFTALTQAYLMPPRVYEMENVAEDFWKPSRWWKNRLTRVFLAFLLPGLPTTIGSILGGWKIFSTLAH